MIARVHRHIRPVSAITIDTALRDHNLLGAALGDHRSWRIWLAVLRAAFGLSLNGTQREAFDAVAGGRTPPSRRVAELWAIAGRRSGKSRIAAAIAVFLALFIPTTALAKGEVGHVIVLSASRAQAKIVFSYCLGFIEESPVLRQQIVRTNAEEIHLKGGIVIGVHTSSFRTIRGRTMLAAIFDESAFWRDETSAQPDLEIYRAVVPALASTHGLLVGISSPYRKIGLLYAKHRDHFGQDGDVLVVQAPSTALNPTLDEAIITAARQADPDAALAEWDAAFRADINSLLAEDVIDAAIDHSRPLELQPFASKRYFAFTDASAGRHDHFTCTIGHNERDRVIVDVLRGAAPPFDPSAIAADYAALAKSYRCKEIVGDNYAAEWVASAFKSAGIGYRRAELTRSELYLEALPIFNRHAVNLPDHARLIRELRLLERRVHRSGKDSVDHGVGGSDDYSNAVAGVINLAAGKRRMPPITQEIIERARAPLKPRSLYLT